MSPSTEPSRRHLHIASVLVCFGKGQDRSSAVQISDLPSRYELVSSSDRRNKIAYRERRPESGAESSPPPPLMVLGDDCELASSPPGANVGNATTLEFNLEDGTLEALTSIPGLPALYVVETPDAMCVTSDLFLLPCVQGLSLRFDPAGIADLAYVGRPVGFRTLFAGVRMIPGGSRISLRNSGDITVETVWTPPQRDPCDSWDDYTALQAEAFATSVASLDYTSCSLSLSSGLDSRATLAGLIANQATVSALTVSGDRQCLDARAASKLCAAYGIEHQTIRLGETFRGSLPELAARASLLSGGTASMWSAAQVYCYGQLGDPPATMALSGYLGNQIGRRGTEGLTPRNVDTSILAQRLVSMPEPGAPAWYAEAMQSDGFLETQFLIQQESTFGNLASYQIGNTHSVQQSAYAYRPLIENMWRIPASEDTETSSHVQNLKHLFLGEPLGESFQRRYINSVGGLVAKYPVNWGWRSRGGVSLIGLGWGGLALLDAVVSSRLSETAAPSVTKALGIAGLHEFRPAHEWMRRDMKPFVYDELLSQTSLESGLFDTPTLQRLLDSYYSDGGRGFKEIVMALDLALAARNFGATA